MASALSSRLGIFKAAYGSVTREMAVDLRRAAFSSIVREARDFSVALTDAAGEVVDQAECIPIMTAGISHALRGLSDTVDLAALTPDDALLMNDPYSGGQHLQDVYLFTPIFVRDRLVAFAASVAHHVDVGGGSPGLNADATELYQEGLRLPLARFSVSRDWNGGFVERIIRANVRVPELVLGDLNAQFAANRTAAKRLGELMDRYGIEDSLAAMDALKDYSERRTRDAIASMPDGEYTAVETLDTSPWGGDTANVVVRVVVAFDHIHLDFTGTDGQIRGNVNCPLASTISAAQSAIRCMLGGEDIPFNEGSNRPLTLDVPYGSVLNPRPPAAVRARLTPASRVFNAIVRALGDPLPERSVATGFDTTTAFAMSHLASETGDYQVVLEILGGGWGACADHEGADALDNPISNCANAPVEALETDYTHLRIVEYAMADGTEGAGRHDGGRGIRRVYEAQCDGVAVSGYADRHRHPAAGLHGGGPGGTGQFMIHRVGGATEELPCVFKAVLDKGDRIAVVTGGGGGYGDQLADGDQGKE
ncbi:MAG: hydantoinase B/oxoprolinase family protein [Streptosporangiales bacterium]|nr:hydantoinase B/oxoprolinase family protein [Streptosporangiales bacterium]